MAKKLGDNVILRAPLPSDLDLLRKLRNDTELQHLLLAHPQLTGPDDTEAWLQRRMNDEHGLFKIIADETNQPFGFVQIGNVHRRGCFGYAGICLEPRARGRGFGTDVISQIMNLALTSLNLRKLILEVRSDNVPALALYLKLGFVTVGTLLEHYYDGKKWYDVVLMERHLSQVHKV
jgi:RimJ/RimL family protein N-acetyltransferase